MLRAMAVPTPGRTMPARLSAIVAPVSAAYVFLCASLYVGSQETSASPTMSLPME